MPESDLQRRLEKLSAQLVQDIERWEQRTRGDRQRVMEEVTRTVSSKLSHALEKLDEKEQRRRRRLEREEERERRRLERSRPTVLGGAVMMLAGVVCALVMLVRPDLWWMVFVSVGLAMGGAKQVTAARRLAAREKEDELDAPRHEVDALCDQLLEDLKQSPEAVRQFISAPEKTVATMRSTLKALDQRRQQLLSEDAPGKLAEVERRRVELLAKREKATDGEARQRLGDAIEGLDGQLAALRQLVVVTERVDGEYTALLVRLQELKTRVSVARSSGTQVQLDGLKGSVQRLNEELAAIAEAMAMAPVAEVVGASEASEARVRSRE